MPIILLFAGFVLLASAVAGTTADLTKLLKEDFTGPKSFLYWLLAFCIVGAVGYVPGLDKISRAFIGLILLSMFLANGTGVIAKAVQAVNSPPTPAPLADKEAASASGTSSAPSSTNSDPLSGITKLLGF